MTCRLDSMHPLDALYQAARKYPGGIEALARRLKMSAATLYNKLRQSVETHHVAYDGELSEILFCLDEAGVPEWADTLHAFCWRHGHLAIPVPQADVGEAELTEAIVTSVKEHAEAVSAIGESLRGDRLIDAREMTYIDQQVEEGMRALAAMRDRARKKHLADFPPTKAKKR